jgi:hypothetical protein
VNVACPEPFNVSVPSVFAPSLNVIVSPLALVTALPPLVTVAVNVTDWPKTEGFADDVTEVVVPHPEKLRVTVRVWLPLASVPETLPVDPDPVGVALPPPVVVVAIVPFHEHPLWLLMLLIVKADPASAPMLNGVVPALLKAFPPLLNPVTLMVPPIAAPGEAVTPKVAAAASVNTFWAWKPDVLPMAVI